MREIYKDIYMKELPLPNNPLKYLNFYLVKGKDKSMIIDTGFNRKDTKEEIMKAFEELDISQKIRFSFLPTTFRPHRISFLF